jgi:hypothetical protein
MIVDVPHEATAIVTGAHLKGTGKLWFKNLKVEEVASSTPTTDCYAMGCVGLWDLASVNLDFSKDQYLPGKKKLAYISAARRWVIGWEPDELAYQLIRPAFDLVLNYL